MNAILVNTETRQAFRLDKPTVLIGSEPAADLVVEGAGVRPYHCAVGTIGHWDLAVWDLGDESRTSVNGRRVMKAILAAGDLLTIGDTVFRVDVEIRAPRI